MKLEMHIHASEVSTCSECTAAQAVQRCVGHGYDGMVTTDHFSFDSVPFSVRVGSGKTLWKRRVEHFLTGYDAAREAAPAGFAVLLGMELRFANENHNDYLVYGFDKEFLYRH